MTLPAAVVMTVAGVFCRVLAIFCVTLSIMAHNVLRYTITALLTAVCWSAWGFTLVIDAGHGGHDHGAIEHKVNEKDVNLAVALQFGAQVAAKLPDIKVVYTRDGDYYRTLQERADIANAARGDLFVSIHANSIDRRNRNRRTIQGASTYTLGLHRSDENLEVAMRENSVMKLEDDYIANYEGFDPESAESYIIFELSQSAHLDRSIKFAEGVQSHMSTDAGRVDKGVRQAGFLVLAHTSMPAVLVELDYLCNPTQAAFMSSVKGQRKLASALTNAFLNYYGVADDASDSEPLAVNQHSDIVEGCQAQQPDTATTYRIQFMTSDTRLRPDDRRFKGLTDVEAYREGRVWKYTVGRHTTTTQARRHLKQVRQKFNDAFIISHDGNCRTGQM